MDDNQRITKSFDFAADITKQLIALSTAILTLCVAFTDKVFSTNDARANSVFLLIALILFVVSIVFGVLALGALAGRLGRPQKITKDGKDIDSMQSPIYAGGIRFLSIAQMSLFVLAITIAVVYVWRASNAGGNQESSRTSDKMLRIIRVSDFSIENSQIRDTLFLDPMNQD